MPVFSSDLVLSAIKHNIGDEVVGPNQIPAKLRESEPTSGGFEAPVTQSGPRHGIARSFAFALAGLWLLLRTQRNARIEMAMGALACILGLWLGITPTQLAIVVLTIVLVLILEGLNTSIEAAVDLFSTRRHPLAKAAKDLAAGMVLLASMGAVGVGLLILGPPLWHRLVH